MHIAQFIHRYPPALGGSEAWIARLSRALVDQGDRVTVWTSTAIDLAAFQQKGREEAEPGITVEHGVTVHRFRPEMRWPGRRSVLKAASLIPIRRWQALTMPFNPISTAMWRASAATSANEGPCDVVHAAAFPYGFLSSCALRLARRKRVPFVLTPFLHLGDPDRPNDRVRRAYTAPHLVWLLRQADRVLVQTVSELNAVIGLGVSADRVTLQGLGVEPSECTGGDRVTARGAWGIRDEEYVVGHLANQSEEKGTVDLLVAAELARRKGAKVRVVLAGPMTATFRRFWNHFGSAKWVSQLGPLTDAQRRDFYAGIDAFCMPSRTDSFGLVFLEAWANGVPVIGYRAGGVADLIRDRTDGRLVRCSDIDGLAESLREMGDRSQREEWGRRGRARTAIEFRWEDKIAIARRVLRAMPSTD